MWYYIYNIEQSIKHAIDLWTETEKPARHGVLGILVSCPLQALRSTASCQHVGHGGIYKVLKDWKLSLTWKFLCAMGIPGAAVAGRSRFLLEIPSSQVEDPRPIAGGSAAPLLVVQWWLIPLPFVGDTRTRLGKSVMNYPLAIYQWTIHHFHMVYLLGMDVFHCYFRYQRVLSTINQVVWVDERVLPWSSVRNSHMLRKSPHPYPPHHPEWPHFEPP